jgi:uncharacterized protein YbjQ (UPF0145 family)
LIISTMNDTPGYVIDEVCGEVFGLIVRSRNVGSQVGASLMSLVGGELKGMTKMLAEDRARHGTAGRGGRGQGPSTPRNGWSRRPGPRTEHATERLVEEAGAKGGNAVIAFRFDTSELGSIWTENARTTAVNAGRRQLPPT